METQLLSQKKIDYSQKTSLWVYQKGMISTPDTSAVTLDATYRGYYLTIKIQHDFASIRQTSAGGDFTYFNPNNLPSFFINEIVGSVSNKVFYPEVIHDWAGLSDQYIHDGTNRYYLRKKAALAIDYLYVYLYIRRLSGTVSIPSKNYRLSYMLFSPLGEYLGFGGMGGGPPGSGIYYYEDMLTFDKNGNYINDPLYSWLGAVREYRSLEEFYRS